MEMKAEPLAVLWLPSALGSNTQTHKDTLTSGSRAPPLVSLDKQRVSAVICRGRDYTAVRLIFGGRRDVLLFVSSRMVGRRYGGK